MKDKGVDFVLTCIDNTAALNLAKEMRKQNMNATQYLPNGYDVNLIAANKQFFQDDIVGVPFVPFQFRPKPPGMVAFDKWMDKAGYEKNEIAINGWISAAMLLRGPEGRRPELHPPEGHRLPQHLDGPDGRRAHPASELDQGARDHAHHLVHGLREGRQREVRADVHATGQAVHVPARPTGEAAGHGDIQVGGSEVPTLITSR